MRALLVVLLCGLTLGLNSCAPQTDEQRTTQEAGGTLPWNRPASWEGGGALGSQMNQMSH